MVVSTTPVVVVDPQLLVSVMVVAAVRKHARREAGSRAQVRATPPVVVLATRSSAKYVIVTGAPDGETVAGSVVTRPQVSNCCPVTMARSPAS